MFDESDKKGDEECKIQPTTSILNGTSQQVILHDEVFGEITENGPNYRGVSPMS